MAALVTPSPTVLTNIIPTFTVFSMNAWFDQIEVPRRIDAQIDLVVKFSPQVAFFQELTPNMFEYLTPLMWSLGYTTPSQATGAESDGYGEAIYLHNTCSMVSYSRTKFENTKQGRHLHIAECTIESRSIAFATAHLESVI